MAILSLRHSFVAALFLLSSVSAQSVARNKGPENHPRLTTYKCTNAGGCVPRTNYLVADALAHPMNQNCGGWGAKPLSGPCPDATTCQRNCIIDPIQDYSRNGVTTNGDRLYMTQLLPNGNVVSPRVYLLEENRQNYEMLQLTGNEFTFDVDMSKLPCGMNGALYLSEMEKDGGKSVEPLNQSGAEFGSGYCDAQCYVYPFANGVGNMEGKGVCCNEMDIWEANRAATSLAPHPCAKPRLFKCQGVECEWEGDCDKWGCSYNPYKVGNPDYYGPSRQFKVDTSRPFTVVTQFPTDSNGRLTAYKRLYVQDGRVIQNAYINVTNNPPLEALRNQNFMDEAYCRVSGGTERYLDLGGTTRMGEALARGMVLIFSVWWDESGGNMQWMDGITTNSGPCNADEGSPANIRRVEPNPAVTFSVVKWGEIGSTYRLNGRRSYREESA
ncbi:glycoside hydrolase [Ascobolus immersus RN42]|uniref:Glucanase n=1 Tax=Ascobolus immersus RN42 TaxID=1160509 RepID=A0A3N4I9V1_ASCIM|nr:glycoside hydrolase [Ascobolus immersus RN42]